MASSSLEGKTIRPGSLGAYSYYRSARRPDRPRAKHPSYIPASRSKLIPRKLIVAILVVAALIALPILNGGGNKQPVASQSKTQKTAPAASGTAAVATPAKKAANHCSGNGSAKLILVSISQRHLWACDGATTAYDSPVITGMTAYPATETPVGTYHIYSKQTHTTLTGTDITGSWSDPVSYWMPFLDNQYGTYGFHDATWRDGSAFGNVDPASSNASHGCVELPLQTSQWLYGWAGIGTAVTIQN
ncbi:MAG TPA: L,D-transpeptidase [Verrucomicrobiae bacterium]|nr:L,D-transpeptidase [Verrucomicrobiae bacterium]